MKQCQFLFHVIAAGSSVLTAAPASTTTQVAAPTEGVDAASDAAPASPTGDASAPTLPPAPTEKPSTPPPRDIAFEEFKKVRWLGG